MDEDHFEEIIKALNLFRGCLDINEIEPSSAFPALFILATSILKTSGISYEDFCKCLTRLKEDSKRVWDIHEMD